MKKNKILFVVNVDWFLLSHRINLIEESFNKGWEVYVCGKDTGKSSEIESYGCTFINIDFDRSSVSLFGNLKNLFHLIKLYSSLKPDIIHHISNKPILLGSIAFRLSRVNVYAKVVNAVSGLGILFSDKTNIVLSHTIKVLLRLGLNSKRIAFIFQNLDDKELFRKLGLLNKDNWIIIKGSGVDEEKYKRNKSLKKSKKLIVTFAARLLIEKGILDFIQASKMLFDSYGNSVEFWIVGGIDEENQNSIQKSELLSQLQDGYLIWKGHCKNMLEIYNETDIACLPSYYREGIPKSLIEAMSVGCPIVTTNAIGCKECVDHGINGFLVPTKDYKILSNYLEQLILNEDLRIRMGRNSRNKMIKEMSLSKVINETFNFYEQLTT